ncbi:MAG: carbohydrate ABC transporter permease [Alphaproteobacteria bacterium]
MLKPTPLGRVLLHAANLLVILFLVFPLIAVVIGAVQSERTLQADTRAILPAEYTFDNFRVILTQGEQKGRVFEQATYLPDNIKTFYRACLNSLIVALSVTLLTLILGSLTAYTIARLRVRWTVWLMQLNIAARFVPIIVLMIPLYVMFRTGGMLNSLGAVILAQTGFLLPYAILILAPYFETISGELEEAARIDGCSRIGAFFRIVLPLSTPGLSSCGAIVFIISWQDLLIAMILNSRREFMTLPVVIASLVGDVHVFFNLLMAICLLALLPSLVLVMLLQKYVVQGLSAGALKG